jgi:hypothetical protein
MECRIPFKDLNVNRKPNFKKRLNQQTPFPNKIASGHFLEKEILA